MNCRIINQSFCYFSQKINTGNRKLGGRTNPTKMKLIQTQMSLKLSDVSGPVAIYVHRTILNIAICTHSITPKSKVGISPILFVLSLVLRSFSYDSIKHLIITITIAKSLPLSFLFFFSGQTETKPLPLSTK